MRVLRYLLTATILLVLSGGAAIAQPAPQNIWTVELSADGKYVALGGDDSTVWVYATENYSLHHSYKLNSMVRCVSWHPREALLAIATLDNVSFLSIPNQSITLVPGLPTGGRGIAWNPSGELLALADGDGVIRIMNRNGQLLRSITKYNNNSYFSIDWHPSKSILVTGSDEIMLFDTSGRQLNLIKHRNVGTGVLTVKWHPSGDFFAAGDYGHDKEGIPTLLQFWREDGALVKEMRGISKAEFRCIKWNHAGTQLATASDVLRIWDKDGRLINTSSASEGIWGIAWNKDDSRIITGNFNNGNVRLWSKSGALIRQIN